MNVKDYFVFVIYFVNNGKPVIINSFRTEGECLTTYALLVQVSDIEISWKALNITAELEQLI